MPLGLDENVTDRHHVQIGWLYYLAEIASKRIRNSVWVERYATPTSHDDWAWQLEKRIAEFDWQIEEWYKALPEPMKFPTAQSAQGIY